MAGVIKIDFKVGNMADVDRALAGISTAARNSASRAAREQAKSGQQQVSQAKSNQAKMLSDAEAAAQAQIGIIRKVNKARVEAAKSQLTLDKELASEASRIESERANAASKARADRAADIAQRKTAAATARAEARATMVAAKEVAAVAENKRSSRMAVASGAAGGFKAGVGIIGAGFSMAAGQAVRQQMGLEERAALLRSASGKSTKDFDSIAQAKGISNLTGVSADEVMGGFEKLSGKAGGGGLTEYTSQFTELAKVAHGAGVNMTDLGDTLGTLYNRGVKADSVVKVVEALVQQGKDGAVEFNQLAVLLDASSGALGRFKMNDSDRVMTAGGLSQFARTFGKKSAEESTNAVEDLARDMAGKADVIQRLTGGSLTRVTTTGKKTTKMVNGKKVVTEEGGGTKDVYAGGVEVGTDASRSQLKDINALLPAIIEGVVKTGNAGKLMGEGGIFTGNATAIAGPLLQAFTQGITKDKEGRFQLTKEGETAGLTGRAAVEAMLTQFQSANVGAGTSQKAFDDRMAQSQAKMNVTIEKLKNDLGTQLAPIASKAIENPKTAAAGLVAALTVGGAAKAGADVAGAALLEKIFPKTVANMSVTAANVVVGGAGGAAGAASAAAGSAGAVGGKAGMGLAAGLGSVGAVLAGGYAASKVMGAGFDEAADLNSNTAGATNLASKIRRDGGTKDERKRAANMARNFDMQGGNFFERFSAANMATMDKVKEDGVGAGSIARLIASPVTSALSAATSGGSANQANAKGASEELRVALAGMKQDPAAMGAAMAGPIADAVGTAVAAASLQTTKVQPP